MEYKQFQNLTLSRLGMGNMRLPKIPDKGEAIDREKARKIIERAYEQGINYFDTAYRYHGGESEFVVGEVLRQYPRDSFYLATKFPGHMMEYRNGKYSFTGLLSSFPSRTPVELFEEQLNKCRVDYFDFYLLHNLCETAWDFYTDRDIAVIDYLLGEKKKGRIRYLGFSSHGSAETIERFINQYPCFDIAQIQLNYLDWVLQNAKRKYEILTEHNIPIIVMEPCRGGRLATLDETSSAMLKNVRPDNSIASWAFRFVKSLPNVLTVLSGMSNLEQMEDNLKTFSGEEPLSEQEEALLEKIRDSLAKLVPCTACRYCCEGCPAALDIPRLVSLYNEMSFDAVPASIGFSIEALKSEERPSACIGCGSCSRVCPQNIDIPDIMKNLANKIAARQK
jgi:predicted aldo/keto reductase-like oxidoreductase